MPPLAEPRVPVIAVTGHLGAGKTSLLNHLLRRPGARLGAIVNDFGALNVDAGLLAAHVDDAVAISGGCVCCLPDAGGLDEALARLADPRLRLDAILVEASGVAEPGALARLVRFSGVERVRLGGVIEVIDAVEHFRTVDVHADPPARYGAATLFVVNKTDLLDPAAADDVLARLRARIGAAGAPIVVAREGRIDPALVFDVADADDPVDQLPIARLLREAHAHDHPEARSASVPLDGPVSPSALLDLLEAPPAGAYRLKGRVRLRGSRAERGVVVNVVGSSVHVARLPQPPEGGELVAIGYDLDVVETQRRLEVVAHASAERPDAAGLRRLERWERLSL